MTPITAVVLFCDDVRDETTNTQTIVGVLPDNIDLPQVPGVLPKLGLYLRVMITPEFDPAPLALWLIFVDGTEREILRIDREVLNLALDEMKKSGAPITGVISKAIFSHFLVPIFGRMKAVLRSDHGETLCGVLNFQPGPKQES